MLLSAIYYKGIDDGPDFDYVVNVYGSDWADLRKKEEELDEEPGGDSSYVNSASIVSMSMRGLY